MRKLIWYLRSAFCKHQWKSEEAIAEFNNFNTKKGIRVSSTCEKCGWHISYWKFM